MKGIASNTSVQGSNVGEVQGCLNLVDWQYNGEFARASPIKGMHRSRLITADTGPYFQRSLRRLKDATLEEFENA